jgi:hypothetical protein
MLCFAHIVVPTCSSRAILPKIRGTDTAALVVRCCVAFPMYRKRSMAAMMACFWNSGTVPWGRDVGSEVMHTACDCGSRRGHFEIVLAFEGAREERASY